MRPDDGVLRLLAAGDMVVELEGDLPFKPEGKEFVLRHIHAHARLGDEPLRHIVRRNEGDEHLRDLGVFIKMRRFSQTAQCVAQRRGASESVPVRPLMRHQKIIVVRAKIRGAFQKFHGYPFSPSLGEASSRWRMMSLM